MNTNDSEDKSKRQLYACLDKESGKTFFASFISQRGYHIDLRSSWVTSRGKSIILMPVPDNWDGKEFDPAQIRESPDAREGNVSRADSRGQIQIRLLTNDQMDILDQLHSGRNRDQMILEQSHAGKIDILKLAGRVSMESLGRLQSALRTEPGTQRLVLMDMRELGTIPSACLGMLHTLLREEKDNGLVFNFLVKSNSRLETELEESRVLDLAPMHDEYETAVAYLLRAILD